MKKIQNFKEIAFYLLFGVCTTVINIAAHYVFYSLLGFSNTLSNVIAWILAVLFAFLTNRSLVFHSTADTPGKKNKEMFSFFFYRAVTLVVDLIIMYLAVDVFLRNAVLWKIISNIIVIVLNFILSKFVIFSKK